MKHFLLSLSICVLLFACRQQPEGAFIITSEDGETVRFAQSELTKFGTQAKAFNFSDNITQESAGWLF